MSRRMSRRRFLAASSAAAGYFYAAPAFSAEKVAGSNDRLRFAGIGVGGKGSGDIDQAGSHGEVVAICDVDESKKHLGAKAEKWPQAKKFTDFRKLFDDAELVRNLDAVVISTPDHTHALPAVLAMRQKKHAYVQKPLTRTPWEAHLLKAVAKKYGVCTQMGNQGTSESGLRRAVELVQSGVIGPVKEVHVWTNRPIWPQAPGVVKRLPKQDVPPTVNWDAFLGPAPDRDYNAGYHPFKWRGWWDFGTGAIGDMACHTANMAFMALKLGHPAKVSAEAGDVNPETCPSYAHVTLEFPARGDLPPVTLHWYEGKKDGKKLSPPAELVEKVLAIDPDPKRNKALVNSGSILVGEKGYIYSPNDYGAQFFVGPKKDFEGLQTKTPEKLPINGGGDGGQKKEWVEAIRAGKPSHALSNFDYASMLTGAFLLGNVAIRTGKSFDWNGDTLTASIPEAAILVKPEYRRGWEMPAESV